MYRLSLVGRPPGEPDSYHLTPYQNPFVWGCMFSLLGAFALTLTISILQYTLQSVSQGVTFWPFSVWTWGAIITGLVLLVGVPVHLGEYYGSKRTVESIEAFEVAVSDSPVVVGRPFTVTYTLSVKQPAQLRRVRFTCVCLFDWGVDSYSGSYAVGFQRERRVATYHAIGPQDRVKGEPGSPVVHAFFWTLPANRLPRRPRFVQGHKAWHLRVYITAHRGWSMRGSFVLPVHLPAGT